MVEMQWQLLSQTCRQPQSVRDWNTVTLQKLKPVIEGNWLIGSNPRDLDPDVQNIITPGQYRSGQEVVDHHIWKDAKGQWRPWACIRNTKVGRFFVGWVSDDLETAGWRCLGVVMRRDKNAGESLADHGDRVDGEKPQSPFVTFEDGRSDLRKKVRLSHLRPRWR